MKKILIIILLVLAVGLIGVGIFFTFMTDDNGNSILSGGSNGSGEVINLDEEISENEEVHSENVHVYRTIEDATAFLSQIYETNDVVVSYNDGVKATIKVFPDTDEEIRYTYHIGAGDLIIEY